MIRLKVKHLALMLVLIVVLFAGSLLVNFQWSEPVRGSAEKDISSYSTAEARLELDRLRGIDIRLEDSLVYVGRDHSSSSGGLLDGQTMELDQLVKRYEQLIKAFPDLDMMATMRLAELYELQYRWDDAVRIYEDALEEKESLWIQEKLDLLYSREQQLGEEPMLSGTVKFGERPMAGVTVYLKKTDATSWSMPPHKEEYPMVMTDDQGRFYFYGIPDEKYDIGVGAAVKELSGYTYSDATPHGIVVKEGRHVEDVTVQFNPNVKIEDPKGRSSINRDSVTLSWEPYPGTAYYKLQFNEVNTEIRGSGYFILPDSYEESTVKLDIHELQEYVLEGRMFQSYGDDLEKEWISPTYILGYAYSGSQYIWSVEAYDQEDHKISSSRPLTIFEEKELPLLVFGDDADLHPGDRKIIEGAYEEAKEIYEQDLSNSHALRVLANLYMFGTESSGERDYSKALDYLKQIENPSLAELRMMNLAYIELGMDQEAERAEAQIQSIAK